jgi:iron-sulfur cluster assembly accessory protein
MTTGSFTVTERAARRIAEIVGSEPITRVMRVSVDGGGCSGFQYRFDLVAAGEPDDLVVEQSGARVVVDPVSLPYMAGSELDFVDDLIGAQFKIKNPMAKSSCGCGTSFSV